MRVERAAIVLAVLLAAVGFGFLGQVAAQTSDVDRLERRVDSIAVQLVQMDRDKTDLQIQVAILRTHVDGLRQASEDNRRFIYGVGIVLISNLGLSFLTFRNARNGRRPA